MIDRLENSFSESYLQDAGIRHSIDCKTSKCVASFGWDNYDAALQQYLAVDINSTDCSRFMLLPEPKNKDAPYFADLILQCKR